MVDYSASAFPSTGYPYERSNSSILYFLIVLVYTIAVFIPETSLFGIASLMTLMKMLRYLCYAGVVIKMIHDRYTDTMLWFMIILGVCCVIVSVMSDNKTALFNTLLIIAAKDADGEDILKASLVARSILLALTVILSQCGVVTDYIFDVSSRSRHGLGFSWTTYAPVMFFFLVLCYACLRREKVSLFDVLVIEAVNYWMFRKTNTRLVFLMTAVFAVIVYIMGLYIRNNQCRYKTSKVEKMLITVPVLCCVLGIVIHAAYTPYNHFLYRLNTLMSTRLVLGHNAIIKYGITLFGQPIRWVGQSRNSTGGLYNFVDCSYLQILLEYGILFLVIVVLLYTMIMYKAVRSKNRYLELSILFICIFCISEARLFTLQYNPFLLLTFSELVSVNDRMIPASIREEWLLRGVSARNMANEGISK